ncbi:MAG: TetR/AcrR family transcriptional regulator [Acidimicrobiales bacterium]
MTSEPQLTNRATRRRRRTHLDLLGSLRRELAQSGVEDLTVGSVTDRADVAVGTFYNHFDDKTSALESLAQIEAEALEISVLDMIERSNDPSPTLPRLVNAMALSVMHRAAVDPVWLDAIAALVDARYLPTPDVVLQVHDILSSANPGTAREVCAWHTKALAAVGCELVRSLRSGDLPQSLEGRIDLVLPSLLGVIGCAEPTVEDEITWAKNQPIPTEWPSTESIVAAHEGSADKA